MSCCDENKMLQSLILIGPHDAQLYASMNMGKKYAFLPSRYGTFAHYYFFHNQIIIFICTDIQHTETEKLFPFHLIELILRVIVVAASA
jgi:hypothetical protein